MRRIGIVGLGLVGGSLGKALRRVNAGLEVVGLERSAEIADRAVQVGAVDAASTDLAILEGVDIIVIATPIEEIPVVIDNLRRAATAPSLITDVASVKSPVLEWAASLPPRASFLGGHPVAGKAEAGLDASDPDIFAGRPWIFTREDRQDVAPFSAWFDLVRAIGSEPVFMPAAQHDLEMAYLSHLAFVMSAAYAETVGSHADRRLAGPGYESMTRLAGGDPTMYEAISRHNRQALLEAIDDFTQMLSVYRDRIGKGDRVRELFAERTSVAV